MKYLLEYVFGISVFQMPLCVLTLGQSITSIYAAPSKHIFMDETGWIFKHRQLFIDLYYLSLLIVWTLVIAHGFTSKYFQRFVSMKTFLNGTVLQI